MREGLPDDYGTGGYHKAFDVLYDHAERQDGSGWLQHLGYIGALFKESSVLNSDGILTKKMARNVALRFGFSVWEKSLRVLDSAGMLEYDGETVKLPWQGQTEAEYRDEKRRKAAARKAEQRDRLALHRAGDHSQCVWPTCMDPSVPRSYQNKRKEFAEWQRQRGVVAGDSFKADVRSQKTEDTSPYGPKGPSRGEESIYEGSPPGPGRAGGAPGPAAPERKRSRAREDGWRSL